jgi:hypothetical protein
LGEGTQGVANRLRTWTATRFLEPFEYEGFMTRGHNTLAIGVGSLNWGNDYPHHDATWPNSMPVLRRFMAGVPKDEVERMCFKNVVDLYQIDVSKLPV